MPRSPRTGGRNGRGPGRPPPPPPPPVGVRPFGGGATRPGPPQKGRRRSAPLTWGSRSAAPADLAAAAPAARPRVLVALDLNDVVHGRGSAGDFGLTGQESVGGGCGAKCERTGAASGNQELAHEGSPGVPPKQGEPGNKVPEETLIRIQSRAICAPISPRASQRFASMPGPGTGRVHASL